jgi:hypothetical protein
MEKQLKEGKYQERRMGCAKVALKLKKNMLSVILRNVLLLYSSTLRIEKQLKDPVSSSKVLFICPV